MARRIVPARKAGLTLDSPFKRGDTAERVLDARRARYVAEDEARAERRRGSRSARTATPLSSARQLRRLRRALLRRTTPVAIDRIRARIAQLEKEIA